MIRFVPFLRAFALVIGLAALPAAAYDSKEISALQAAQRFADQKDWEGAKASAMAAGAVGADVIEWQRLRAGDGLLGDYEAFMAQHPDWPGMPYLKTAGEAAVARSQDPARILAYFGPDRPKTAAGALALMRAKDATGHHADAVNEATRAWAALKFSAMNKALSLDFMRQIWVWRMKSGWTRSCGTATALARRSGCCLWCQKTGPPWQRRGLPCGPTRMVLRP